MIYTDNPFELEAQITPLTFDEACIGMCLGFYDQFRKVIQVPALACLLAQSALETGNFQVGLWLWNLLNDKSDVNKLHQYFRCNEVFGSERQVVWFDPSHRRCSPRDSKYLGDTACKEGDPPHGPERFSAHRRSRDGFKRYVRFLGVDMTPHNGRPNRYGVAWEAAMAGDADGFARELKKAGYYTADVDVYARGVVKIAQANMRRLEGFEPSSLMTEAPEKPDPVTDDDVPGEGEVHLFSDEDREDIMRTVRLTSTQQLNEWLGHPASWLWES